jgi:hypothetical protein
VFYISRVLTYYVDEGMRYCKQKYVLVGVPVPGTLASLVVRYGYRFVEKEPRPARCVHALGYCKQEHVLVRIPVPGTLLVRYG